MIYSCKFILDDIMIRSQNQKLHLKIIEFVVSCYFIYMIIAADLNSIVALNFSFGLLFMFQIQHFINQSMEFHIYLKIYFQSHTVILMYLEMLIMCIILFPVALILNVNIIVFGLLATIFSMLFTILSYIKLNSYTNWVLVFFFIELLSQILV